MSGSIRGAIGVLLACLVLLLPLAPATAQGGRSRDIQVAPGCVIHIEVPPPLTAQKTADLNTVEAALNAALRASADMRTKVADACQQNGGTINVVPVRDLASVFIGEARLNNNPRVAIVDLGDIESVGMFLSGGTAADRQAVADGFLTRILAHEIDHLRDRPRERHLDPTPGNAHRERGAGVDDANRVLDQTGNDTFREQYAVVYRRGRGRGIRSTFRVNGHTVTWDSSGHQRFTRQQRRARGAARNRAILEDPFATFPYPVGPCEEGVDPVEGNCWVPLGADDGDLDLVPDLEDICPGEADTDQHDLDADGLGDACDDDVDGDGQSGALESGLGASDLSADSTPESWAAPGTCTDGGDNDADGLIDAADASCTTPAVYAALGEDFPDTLVGTPVLLTELGASVPGAYPFMVSCSLGLTDPEGQPVAVDLTGVAVMAPPALPPTDVSGFEPVQLPGLLLQGELPDGGLVQVVPPPHLPPSGQLIPADPDQPGLLPGDLTWAFHLQIELPGLQLFNHEPILPPPSPLGSFPGGFLIPPDPTLGGLELHTQALVVDPATGPGGPAPRGDTTSGWTLESFALEAAPVIVPLAGSSRVETAAAVAGTLQVADTVLLARADDYPDALAGAPLAAALHAPILLTDSTGLSDAAAVEIDRLGATNAVVLGGEGAISSAVADALADLGLSVERLAGPSRFHTAGVIAQRLADVLGRTDLPEVYVAEGADADPRRGWPDALSVSPLAAAQGRPILMVDTDALPGATADAMAALGVTQATIVGGTAAVSDAVATTIADTGVRVDRVAGPSRYATSAALATLAAPEGAQQVWIATGLSFPDALVAGPAAGRNGAPLVLVDGTDLDASPATRDHLASLAGLQTTVFLGGEAAISQRVRDQVAALG